MKKQKIQERNYRLHKRPEGFIVTSDEIYKGKRCETLEEYYSKFYSNDCGNTERLIIAQQDQIDFSDLSKEEQKEIGWYDVEKLYKELFPKLNQSEDKRDGEKVGFKIGCEIMQELLSDRKFTKKEVLKIISDMSIELSVNRPDSFDDIQKCGFNILQSLSQPKSWTVELEMEGIIQSTTWEYDEPEYYRPKITNGKIKILKIS